MSDNVDRLLKGIETRLWPKGFPCPRCHSVTWAAVPHVDQFRCHGCGYVVDGVEVASWRARNTGS